MKYLTTKEAADFLKISIRTLRRWVKSGRVSRSVAGDKFTGDGDKYTIQDLEGVTNLKYSRKKGATGRGKGDIFSVEQLKKVQCENRIATLQIQKKLNKITSPNDKLVKKIFNLPDYEWQDAITLGATIRITEKVLRGKKIQTRFEIEGIGSVEIARSLDEYDRAVLDACISAYAAGFEFITVDALLKVLTGSKHKDAPYPAQKADFLESVDKLMSTLIKIDFSDTREKMYSAAEPKLVSNILPCEYLNLKVNGQSATVIHFLAESPIMKIARWKKQIITYPVELLAVPNLNNTLLVVTIKFYLIRRVLEIIQHHMTPTITFDDVFEKCGLADADKWKKQDARQIILKIMEHLKTNGVITGFEAVKRAGKFYSITILS